MGRQLKQLSLLIKKNFILLWQRKWQVLFEIFLTFLLLLAFSFLKGVFQIEETCMRESKMTDPLHNIWGDEANRKIIAISPNSELVRAVSDQMTKMPAYKLTDDVDDAAERIFVNEGNYTDVLRTIKDGEKKYLVVFSTNEIFDDYVRTSSGLFRAAIIFEGDDKNVSYSLRYHKKDAFHWGNWNTERLYLREPAEKTMEGGAYDNTGFAALQRLIESSILMVNKVDYNPAIALRLVPIPSIKTDPFVDNLLTTLLPLSMLIGAFLITSSIASDIVEEKCSKMREIQRMMGLTDTIMWLSWIIQRSSIIIACSALNTIGLMFFGYTPSSDGTVIFVFLLCYYGAHTSYIIFIASLQRNLKAAPAIMGFLTFIEYLPYSVLASRIPQLGRGVKILLSVLPLSGASIGFLTIAEWEKIRLGAQWSNIDNGISAITEFSVSDVMLMLFFDIFIFGALTWYVENVFPGEFGVPNSPLFFLTKSYWCGTTPKNVEVDNHGADHDKVDPEFHEKVTQNLKAGIVIKNLNKSFQTLDGEKVAVNNLSVEMYEGQITALLGHNGAGKTTTINMLTGMYPPSSGEATVGGHNIIHDMTGVRESMGVCPQHNILFKFLTVQQHLDFFIRLKGIEDEKEIADEIEQMLESLGIEEKRHEMSKSLSGGLKRKLSVGIALSGGSKVVLLDEPSTGMDVSGKRDLWDMLLKLKAGRTIIITTHSMDEADLLGDRIAIMAAGQLVCSGSSLFLKRKYGVGYHLTLVKESADMADAEVENLTTFIQSHVPSATCHSNVGSELSYLLSANDVQHFVKLFQVLEEDSENYGVASFGVSLTTMEEVFMKAGEGHDSNVAAIDADNKDERKIRKFNRNELNWGTSLLLQQFLCLLKKRAIVSKRNKWITLGMFFIPILFILVGLFTYKGMQSVTEGVPRVLSLAEYPNNDIRAKVYFADVRETRDDRLSKIKDYLNNELDVMLTDVTDETDALEGSYGGTPEDCCSNPYLQLNTECIGLNADKFNVCYDDYDDLKFTYTFCRASCFDIAVDEDKKGADCTVSRPNEKDPNEKTNYYQNVYLKKATENKGSFFVDVQGGLTLSDTSDSYTVYNKEGKKIQTGYKDGDTLVKLSAEVLADPKGDVITGWISYEGFHLIPAFSSAITNLILEMNDKEVRVTATNKPLPEFQDEGDEFRVTEDVIGLVITYIFAGAFIYAVFTQSPVDERISKSKHLQQISGANSAVYWLSMLTWDFLVYFLCSLLIFFLILAFQVTGLTEGEYCATFFLTIILAGLASIPLVYILSHLFDKTSSAYGVITMFFFFISLAGFLCYMIVYPIYEAEEFINKIKGTSGNKYEWVIHLDRALLIHPHYAFASSMYNLMLLRSKYLNYQTCMDAVGKVAADCAHLKPDALFTLNGNGVGRHVLALAIGAIVYMGGLVIIETWWFVIRAKLMKVSQLICSSKANNGVSEAEDDNVTSERTRVNENLSSLVSSESVVMRNLHRQFGKITAVQNLSLAIAKGECFGLLGVNGAGKTTTFNMMTGDTVMTSGKGYLYGHDVTRNLRTAQKFIGYCPQFDALTGQLTGRELLEMFANLRGVPYSALDDSVNEVIRMFNLEDHAEKECRSYSGGNKRKLSTGLAIIGSPPLIFLDEPTAGMDPTARRFLWDVLCYLRGTGCSIVLTSHSMEECEALCTRIVIMVNGACRCLGSIQELKNTYSQGYTVCLLMDPEHQTNVINFVEEQFKGAILKESYPGYLMFSLGIDYKWSYIFEILETNKVEFNLKDYSVAQTSLEQVFLNFAKEQREPDEKKKGWFGRKKKKNGVNPKESRVSLKKSIVSENRASDLDHGNSSV